jgi:hypothetical protein
MRRFTPQTRAAGLADHPHRLQLKGRPGTLDWPSVCPNCGGAAGERLEVRKVFHRRRRRGRDRLVVGRATIPFCAACAARHRAEEQTMTFLQRVLSCLATPVVISPIGAGIVFVLLADATSAATPADAGWTLRAALLGFLALVVLGGLVGMWRETRHRRVPPQTDVTLACDFSDDLGNLLVGSRRIYAIRDPAFAEAFAEANRDRLWTAADRVRVGRIQAVAVGVVLGLAGTAWLWRRLDNF